jgi:hypothetical protein
VNCSETRFHKLLWKDLRAFQPFERFAVVFVELQYSIPPEKARARYEVYEQVRTLVFAIALVVNKGY